MFNPDEARQFLRRVFESDTETEEQKRQTYIFWELQSEIMQGAHAGVLAELAMKTFLARASGDTATAQQLEAEADAIKLEIQSDIERQLEDLLEQGKEMPWATWPD